MTTLDINLSLTVDGAMTFEEIDTLRERVRTFAREEAEKVVSARTEVRVTFNNDGGLHPLPIEASTHNHAGCRKCSAAGKIDWTEDNGKDPFFFSAAGTVVCVNCQENWPGGRVRLLKRGPS